MPLPTNTKGRTFSWSYSAWIDYNNCPAKYAASKFYFTLPWVETEEAKWGNRVHKAAEMFLLGRPFADHAALDPVEPYCTALLRSGNGCEPEKEIVLNADMQPVTWFAKDAWFRAKVDVVVTMSRIKVNLWDFKSGGKIKSDEEQLRLSAAALKLVRPNIETAEGRYIWTQHKEVVPIKPVKGDDFRLIWEEYCEKAYRMQRAWETETFPERPSGLCPWCPKPDCPKRRGERRV